MPLRRFTTRESAVNLVMVALCEPVYHRREWATRDRLDAFALKRAVEMAVHAGAHVPAYRDLYAAEGVDPRAIAAAPSLDAFRTLPIMDKATIREGFPARSCVEGVNLDACLLSTSSGSSGLMMTIPHRADRMWPYLVSGQRMLRWAARDHYPFWYRQAYVYTSSYPMPSIPGLYPMTFIPTAADPAEILAALERLEPHILHTYPTVLRDLVALAPDRMAALRLRGVSVGSELSTQAERDGWEAAIGAPVRDEYSSEELGRIASQCPEGRYHLHEDVVLTEIVAPDGRPTDGLGEIVGTEFHNRTMPFVRYRQGDLARISDEPCPCGRHTRLLVDLVGRRNDGFVLRDGRTLPAGFLLDVCYRAILGLPIADAVSAYRFVQRSPERATFEVLPGRAWHDDLVDVIAAALRTELPADLAVEVAVVAEIGRGAGGKRSTVVRAF
jgi:phenylacetate-CoA ligase